MEEQPQEHPKRDLFCDLGDLSCGDLVMALMKTLRPLPPKAILEVRALDSAAPVDIYAWCKLTGHTFRDRSGATPAVVDVSRGHHFGVDLLNRVVEGIEGIKTGLHVCRGNWSRQENVLLQGAYDPLRPYFSRMQVKQLVLEYATELPVRWTSWAISRPTWRLDSACAIHARRRSSP